MDTVLSETQLEEALQGLDVAWSSIPGQGLVRVYDTGSFAEGVALIAKIAEVAEKQEHHPDVFLTPDDVEVTLTTHSAGGVTQRDVAMAQELDKLGQLLQ